MEPNSLTLMWSDAPVQIIRTGTSFPGMGKAAPMHTRLPAGHPEGFIEAFANIYRNFAMQIIALNEGRKTSDHPDYPGIHEGVRGMKFLEAVVYSSGHGSVLVNL